MKPDVKELLALLLIGFACMGTTYVVKEGAKEVGRYSENDGKTDTVEVDNNAASHVPVRKKTETMKASQAEVWAARRGPNRPGSSERRAKEAAQMTPAQALAQAGELQRKSEQKKAETEAAVQSLQ